MTDTRPSKLTMTEKGVVPVERGPKRIRLSRLHSFIEDGSGRHRVWRAGDVISDPQEIALLIGRGAVHDVLE